MQNLNTPVFRGHLARLCLLLLLGLLAGCSALRFGYANGDTFLYWWLDGYVDFTDAQKPWVKRDIDQLLAWHRKTQLPDYARLLAGVQQKLASQASADEVLAEYAQIRKRADVAIERALPHLTELALSLEPEQIAHLERKFASNNDSYRKEYLRGSVEDRQRLRFKKVMKQAEYWFGNFSDEQEARIRAASDARPLDNEIWLAERQRRQQEMLKMLKKLRAEQPSREAAQAMLRDYAQASFDNFTYAEHRQFFDGTRQGMAEMIATIINIATPQQREHASQRLQKWIDDSRALAAR
ncbi:DUF6279 family lipoprotein [Noviherbaspirillum aridicola]|uniref:Lipoprotein n=1 Tax=Noviherbaspirillum aridicola TaxID=2849687 RepID=A0ABQ4Q4I9_9BURK|nr:DUF6279 family lipoprotein [Noviherbaspirillum aridicola]GIZ51926.1 hypothetical protein NCCP691_19400 [Noviherbaspirillum aridicola]